MLLLIITSFLLSFHQGALAALVFVAFNSEVREAVLLRWYQWQYNNHTEKELSSSEKVFIETAPRRKQHYLPSESKGCVHRTFTTVFEFGESNRCI